MRSSLRPVLLSFLLCVTGATFLAAQPGDPVALGTTPLERALETINAAEISADLHFLASDALQGRDTPSAEQRIAARFIAARLARLGFTPGAQEGYFWSYSLPTVAVDLNLSNMEIASGETLTRLALGTDYAFYPGRVQYYEVSGTGAVYAGTMSDTDCEGLNIEDRWVICRSSELSYSDLNRAVRKGKGLGVLLLAGGELDAATMDSRVASWAQKVGEGRLGSGRSNSKARPYVYLSSAGEQKLFRAAGNAAPKVGDTFDLKITETRAKKELSEAGLENVIGLWTGDDPVLRDELIILSAHYDHVGIDGEGGIFNGADDNGSGTSALLAVAEALSAYGPMRRSVMLMWVSGEEKGLLGSDAWTKDPYLPGGLRPVLNVNIDMVGRNDPNSLLITPTKEHHAYNGLTKLAEKLSSSEGFTNLGSADAYWGRSDHANFSRNLKIPVAFLFADVHEDYHKVTDTPDKIDYDKVKRVSRLVVRMLAGLQDDKLDLN